VYPGKSPQFGIVYRGGACQGQDEPVRQTIW
jgi:hypothetical protein